MEFCEHNLLQILKTTKLDMTTLVMLYGIRDALKFLKQVHDIIKPYRMGHQSWTIRNVTPIGVSKAYQYTYDTHTTLANRLLLWRLKIQHHANWYWYKNKLCILRATSHTSQETWPWNCESQKEVSKGYPKTLPKSCSVVTGPQPSAISMKLYSSGILTHDNI